MSAQQTTLNASGGVFFVQSIFFSGAMILLGIGIKEDKVFPEIVLKTWHMLELLSLKKFGASIGGQGVPENFSKKVAHAAVAVALNLENSSSISSEDVGDMDAGGVDVGERNTFKPTYIPAETKIRTATMTTMITTILNTRSCSDLLSPSELFSPL